MTTRSHRERRFVPAGAASRRRHRPRRTLVYKAARPAPEFTPAEGIAIFDREARRELNISGEEFLRRWDAGEFKPIIDAPEWHSKVMSVAMLLPFVRALPATNGR
ncbi:MAG: hypothetical protein NTZ05_00275 [Chloroflexi bacterium]|nr:hypothetical protein [Chloroflexota bacterium]